jgi:parvulin-like peptidyl-prolyl isomerase
MANWSFHRASSLILMILLAESLSLPAFAQQPPKSQPAKPQTSKATPSTQTAAEGPDAVVLKVGSEQATKAELDFLISNLPQQGQQVITQQGRRPLCEQYALMLLLSQQALKDHLDSAPKVRRQIIFQHKQALAQAEYAKLSDQIQVTPEDVNQYYSAHIADYDQAKVREFLVRKKLEGAKEGTVGLPPKEAEERAESIRKAVAAGTELKKIIEQFGGTNDVMIDIEPRTVRRGQLLPPLDKAAFELKDGELTPPVDNPQAIAFLQVVGHNRQDVKEVTPDIEKALHQQKLDSLVGEIKDKAHVWMDEEYFKAPAAPPTAESSKPKP